VPTQEEAEGAGNTSVVDVDQLLLGERAGGDSLPDILPPDVTLSDVALPHSPLPDVPLPNVPLPNVHLPGVHPDGLVGME